MCFKNVEEKQLNKKQTESPSKLKIIPLGGLEQIGLNITAFEYEDSIKTVLLWWTAVWHFRRMICSESIWLSRM